MTGSGTALIYADVHMLWHNLSPHLRKLMIGMANRTCNIHRFIRLSGNKLRHEKKGCEIAASLFTKS
jgi:hypothetical protein